MADITIHPGGTVTRDGNVYRWLFQATVDGQAGVVRFGTTEDYTETEVAEQVKSLLERHPERLEGIV